MYFGKKLNCDEALQNNLNRVTKLAIQPQQVFEQNQDTACVRFGVNSIHKIPKEGMQNINDALDALDGSAAQKRRFITRFELKVFDIDLSDTQLQALDDEYLREVGRMEVTKWMEELVHAQKMYKRRVKNYKKMRIQYASEWLGHREHIRCRAAWQRSEYDTIAKNTKQSDEWLQKMLECTNHSNAFRNKQVEFYRTTRRNYISVWFRKRRDIGCHTAWLRIATTFFNTTLEDMHYRKQWLSVAKKAANMSNGLY